MSIKVYNHYITLPEPTIQLTGKIFDSVTSRIQSSRITITKNKTVRKLNTSSLNPKVFYNDKNPELELVFYKRVKISISDTPSLKRRTFPINRRSFLNPVYAKAGYKNVAGQGSGGSSRSFLGERWALKGSTNKVGKYSNIFYTLNGKDPRRTKAFLWDGNTITLKENSLGDNIILKARTYYQGEWSDTVTVEFRIIKPDSTRNRKFYV